MAEWYERLTDEQIAWLKSNRVQYRLLTPAEATHMSEVPMAEMEYYYDRWHPVTNSTRYYGDTVYRLRPDWERPKKKKWVFEDIKIGTYGLFTPSSGCTPYKWHDQHICSLDGFVGIVWKWRGDTWCIGPLTSLLGTQPWLSDPSVEPPHPVAVRFRREVNSE